MSAHINDKESPDPVVNAVCRHPDDAASAGEADVHLLIQRARELADLEGNFGQLTTPYAKLALLAMAGELERRAAPKSDPRLTEQHWKSWADAKVAESQAAERFQLARVDAAEARLDRAVEALESIRLMRSDRPDGPYPKTYKGGFDAMADVVARFATQALAAIRSGEA